MKSHSKLRDLYITYISIEYVFNKNTKFKIEAPRKILNVELQVKNYLLFPLSKTVVKV